MPEGPGKLEWVRLVSVDALLSVLAQRQHLTVFGCIAAAGGPVSMPDLTAATARTGVDAASTERSVRILQIMRLVTEADGGLSADPTLFSHVRERFVDDSPVLSALRRYPGMRGYVRDGRLDRPPKAAALRRTCAEFVAACLPPMGTVSEPELNAYLRGICVDHAEVRRLLVDEGVLHRDAAGSRYWIPETRMRHGDGRCH